MFRAPEPINEPNKTYAPGTPERAELRSALDAMRAGTIDVASVIGGERVETAESFAVVEPHAHARQLARVARAGPPEVERAIAAAGAAHPDWSAASWEERATVFLRAADLLAGPWRARLNAATMLGQSKTAHQAEIDAACELIDFWRFNVEFAQRIYDEQPLSPEGVRNELDYRPLEGFVFAVTPFNFTAIAGNLPTSAALMGNTVVWKPASTAAYAAHFLMELLEEAGLPPGVINLVFGDGATIGNAALASPDLAGIHFTGSTPVFNGMWRTIAGGMERYRNYPRIVGETGGKDFILAHPSADPDVLATAVIRGAFEYQGQKCSAASRLFIPASLWPGLRDRLVAEVSELPMGDVTDFRNFMGAVIDAKAFAKHREAIDQARAEAEIVVGGGTDDSVGWFVEPTIVLTADPDFRLLKEELFGPIATAFVYPDAEWDATLDLVDRGSPYALTGAVHARDEAAVAHARQALRYSAGNFYVNDKPTGAVVGQQPFGGARASGTNDKAGSLWNLIRWTSPRAVKETLDPPTDYRYPFMDADEQEGAL
ncbi:MAG: 1-pyrroline-5-carboxylate dehydrogenase [Gaiellaceae bacterium]|nr:1-pyrroline-5-carboxylate dehydrogenase [Gaiellaceae bacterium]